MSQNKLDPRQINLLAGSLASGIALRFYRLDHPQLWLDEILQLLHFRHSNLWENLAQLRIEIAAVPLDYLIQKAVVTVAGQGEFWVRFHAAVFGSLSLFVFYLLARQLLTARSAVFSTILLAFFPLHWIYSREGRNYSLFFFLTLCSFLTLENALRQGGRTRWLLCGLANLGLLYSNYFGLLILGVQLFWVSALWTEAILRRRRSESVLLFPRTIPFVGSWLIPLALFLPWLIWTSGSVRPGLHHPLTEEDLWLRLFKEISGGSYPLSLLLLLLAGAGWCSMVKDRNWRLLSLTAGWFLLPVPSILILDWWGGYFVAIRQFLFATPGLLLASASGMESLTSILPARRGKVLQVLSLALVVLLGTGTVLLSDKKEEADWKGMAARLREEMSEEAVLICAPGLERIVQFYLPGIEQRSVPIERIMDTLQADPAARILLVESRYQSPSERDAIAETLTPARSVPAHTLTGFRIYILRWTD